MNILFFDTETTGVPKNYKAPIHALDNWPRVIQLAWEVVDAETQKVKDAVKVLVKPDGWKIPVEKFWIDNGYCTETNEQYGTPMPEVLDMFVQSVNESGPIVAHNMGFDFPVIAAELLRYNKRANPNPGRVKICTMQNSIELCKIPFPKGGPGYKFPKLEELHQFLFKKGLDGAHDAGNDVAACRVSFFELVRRGIIKLPKITA